MSKKDPMQEFLDKGGKVSKHPYIPPEEEKRVVKSTTGGPPTLYSLDEAAHFFSENRAVKTKKKIDLSNVDWSAIPESLHFILKGSKNEKSG